MIAAHRHVAAGHVGGASPLAADQQASPPPVASNPELPTAAEVVIIGAGFAGTATAWALRRRGVSDVIVLEREASIGRFASGRSAGLGRQLTDDDHTTELTARGAALLRGLDAWSPTGGLLSFDNVDMADEYVVRARAHGIPTEACSTSAITSRWRDFRDLHIAKSLWVPSDGTIDVAALLRVFTSGVRVATSMPVVAVEPEGSGAAVVTTTGAIAARVVVDASGAWAGQCTGDAPLRSFKRHIFVLEAQIDSMTPWWWHLGSEEMYIRCDGSDILASPCDTAPCEPGHQEPDPVGQAHMRRLLRATAPELAPTPFVRAWACQRAFTSDGLMKVGSDATRPWLVWAAGLGGHGATAAPAVGERAAMAVIDAL